MINGMHAVIFSTDAAADRAFFRDIFELPDIDAGDGWLMFGLPPSELAFHPSDDSRRHEIYLMCADIDAFVAAMKKRSIACSDVDDQGWGLLSSLTLPGGGSLGVYQPRHQRPPNPA